MNFQFLALGFCILVVYASAQEIPRAARMDFAAENIDDSSSSSDESDDTRDRKFKAEFHHKIDIAKQSLSSQSIDPALIEMSNKFLDCIKNTDKGMIMCNDETIGQLPEDQRQKYYDTFSKIAPPASESGDEE